MKLTDAIDLAKQEIKQGYALRYHVEDGILDVETDQGWSQWYPLPYSQSANDYDDPFTIWK